MYGRLRPQRLFVRSLSVPINSVVKVAVMALAATIQATGRGSGVMVSKTKVLNQAFSTAQAICPVNASATITNQMRGVIPRLDEFCIGILFPSDENNLFYQRS
jgi:hypothetical protein